MIVGCSVLHHACRDNFTLSWISMRAPIHSRNAAQFRFPALLPEAVPEPPKDKAAAALLPDEDKNVKQRRLRDVRVDRLMLLLQVRAIRCVALSMPYNAEPISLHSPSLLFLALWCTD
jgi:hypothetical protein